MTGKIIITKEEWKKLMSKARKGDPEAQWEVGATYEDGAETESGEVVVKRQPKRAFQWFKKSAEQGYSPAQDSLGICLSTGTGVERDMKAAIFWTKKAIEQGNGSASINLSTIYRDLANHKKEFYWYKKAVDMGEMDALYNVGLCYLLGIGTKQDFRKAIECMDIVRKTDPENLYPVTVDMANYWSGLLRLLRLGKIKRSFPMARKLLETADKDNDNEQANDLLNIIGKTKFIVG